VNTHSPLRTLALAALAAVVIYLCFFSRLDALGLVGPDEPRYAAVARQMADNGDWVTPRLDGESWLEKPVLYYWGAAAAFSLFGVSEFAARLPSALAALLAALAMGWTAWRVYGAAATWAVLLIFPTSLGVLGFARAAATDMVFAAPLAVALAAATELVLLTPPGQRPRRRWQILLGASLGAAVLAKGPAGVLLVGGSVVVWAVMSGRWAAALRPLYPLAILSFAVVALPWYIACARANPEFVEVFLVGHNVERFFTPTFQHVQPFWFFGPIVLLGLVPWTALLAGVAAEGAARGRRLRASPGLFFACWALFPVALFSLSQSKLPGYVLPSLAPLALLMARTLTRTIAGQSAAARWLLAAAGASIVFMGATGNYWLARLPGTPAELGLDRAGVWLGVVVAAGVLVALFGLLRLPWLALALAALLVAGLAEVTNRELIPVLDPHLSPRATAQLADRADAAEGNIHVHRLHRAWHYGLNFYLGAALPRWTEDSGPGWVYASEAGWRELEELGRVEAVVGSHTRQAVLLRTR
jgi:4-amino-4-deoxy-L-arabinose transferase-like glycosyltransferase